MFWKRSRCASAMARRKFVRAANMDDQRIGPNFFERIGKGFAQADAKSSASGNSTRQIQLGQVANEIAGFHDSDRKQANVVQGLGLKFLNDTVEVMDTPAMRGMIHKVRHLVEVA